MSWLEVRPLRRKKSPVRAARRASAARAVARGVTGSGRWRRCGWGLARPLQRSGRRPPGRSVLSGGRQSGVPRSGNREAGRRRRGGSPRGGAGAAGCREASPDRARGRECREGSPAERESAGAGAGCSCGARRGKSRRRHLPRSGNAAGRCEPESPDRARGREFRRAAEKRTARVVKLPACERPLVSVNPGRTASCHRETRRTRRGRRRKVRRLLPRRREARGIFSGILRACCRDSRDSA